MTAFGSMGIAEIRRGLIQGEFSAQEIAAASLERIQALDGAVHSFLETTESLALQQAALVDEAIAAKTFEALGPLSGVPMAVKDCAITFRPIRLRVCKISSTREHWYWVSSIWMSSLLAPPRKPVLLVPHVTRGIWSMYQVVRRAVVLLQ